MVIHGWWLLIGNVVYKHCFHQGITALWAMDYMHHFFSHNFGEKKSFGVKAYFCIEIKALGKFQYVQLNFRG